MIEQDPRFEWQHGIQTNLLNYDDGFAELYHEKFSGEVGVSWDPGTIRRIRKGDPASSVPFHETFFNNLGRLVSDGLSPYLVITATHAFFEYIKNPYPLVKMLEENNVKRLHIERLTKTGNARENWDSIGVSNIEYSQGMSRRLNAYILYVKDKAVQPFFISPLDGILDSVKNMSSGGYGCLSGGCDTTFHTSDANGFKSGCSALTSEYDNQRLPEGVSPIKFTSLTSERESRQVKQKCDECQYRSICSSGCLAVDMSDGTAECSGGYNLFEAARHLIQN